MRESLTVMGNFRSFLLLLSGLRKKKLRKSPGGVQSVRHLFPFFKTLGISISLAGRVLFLLGRSLIAFLQVLPRRGRPREGG